MITSTHPNWAELWLVNKNLLYGLGQNPVAGRMLTLLDFGLFLKIPRIVGKSSAHPVGVFFPAPRSSQMPHTAKIKKIQNSQNKNKNALELRLDYESDEEVAKVSFNPRNQELAIWPLQTGA